jgi:hypothetical protein
MGSLAQIQSSEIGVNGTVVGSPSYNACKFDNGLYSNNTANHAVFVVSSQFNPNAFIVDFWINTDFSVTNDSVSDAGIHNFMGFASPTTYNFTTLGIDNGSGLRVNSWVSSVSHDNFLTGATWSASTNTHICFVFDRTGIGGGANIARAYIDGILVNSSATAVPNQVRTDFTMKTPLYWDGVTLLRPLDGVIDNIKIYNVVSEAIITAVLNNRNNEGFPSAVVSKTQSFIF